MGTSLTHVAEAWTGGADAGDAAQLQRIDGAAALDAIEPVWCDLHRGTRDQHVMLDFRWVRAWWEHFGDGKELHVLLIRDGRGAPLAIAPLVVSRGWEAFPSRETLVQMAEDFRYIRRERYRRLIPIRRLTFPLNLASSNLRAHFLGQGHLASVPAVICRYARAIARRWDLFVLEGLPAESGQRSAFAAAATSCGLSVSSRHYERRLGYIPLPATMEDYLQLQSRRFRKNLNHACNQAERRAGPLSLERYRGDQIDRGMATLFELERRSWKTRPDHGRRLDIQLDERMRCFHLSVARDFARTDEAEVLVLRAAGEPVVGLYVLESNRRAVTVLTYMDEASRDTVTAAPLFRALIKGLIKRSLEELDFNGSTQNVQKWATQQRVCQRLIIHHHGPYSSLLRGVAAGAGRLAHLVRRSPARTHLVMEVETGS